MWRNTLLDENNAYHLALGRGIPSSVEDGPDLSAEEQLAAGINDSELHVDFVVGSSNLDVHGITHTSAEEELMRQGEWAFEV